EPSSRASSRSRRCADVPTKTMPSLMAPETLQAPVDNQPGQASPRTPLHGRPTTFDRRGARAGGHAARPPARFSSLPNPPTAKQNNSHRVTPFWHNDTRPRVTVTFGARRPSAPPAWGAAAFGFRV